METTVCLFVCFVSDFLFDSKPLLVGGAIDCFLSSFL